MSKVITCFSYKGGTGRTTGSANIAYQLALRDHRVLTADLDIDGPGLMHLAGLNATDVANKNIVKYLASKESVDPQQNISRCIFTENSTKVQFDCLPAPMEVRRDDALDTFGEKLPAKMAEFRRTALERYDYTILDTASGVSDFSSLAFSISDYVFVFFRWSMQHAVGTAEIAALLSVLVRRERFPLKRFFLVASAVPDAQSSEQKERQAYVTERLTNAMNKFNQISGAEILVIREDNDLKWKERIVKDSSRPIFSDYSKIADVIAGL